MLHYRCQSICRSSSLASRRHRRRRQTFVGECPRPRYVWYNLSLTKKSVVASTRSPREKARLAASLATTIASMTGSTMLRLTDSLAWTFSLGLVMRVTLYPKSPWMGGLCMCKTRCLIGFWTLPWLLDIIGINRMPTFSLMFLKTHCLSNVTELQDLVSPRHGQDHACCCCCFDFPVHSDLPWSLLILMKITLGTSSSHIHTVLTKTVSSGFQLKEALPRQTLMMLTSNLVLSLGLCNLGSGECHGLGNNNNVNDNDNDNDDHWMPFKIAWVKVNAITPTNLALSGYVMVEGKLAEWYDYD